MSLTATDLNEIKTIITEATSGLASKADLQEAVAPLATKADLLRTERRIVDSVDLLQRDTFDRLDSLEQQSRRA